MVHRSQNENGYSSDTLLLMTKDISTWQNTFKVTITILESSRNTTRQVWFCAMEHYSQFKVHCFAHNTSKKFLINVHITECSLPLKSKSFRQVSHRPLSGQELQCHWILRNLLDETATIIKRQLYMPAADTFSCGRANGGTQCLMTALTRVTAVPIVKPRLCWLCWKV